MASPAALKRVRKAALEELRLLEVSDQAQNDPKYLINEIRYFDPTTEQWVEFRMFPPPGWECPDLSTGPAKDWYWQASIIDWWQEPGVKFYLILKARQLGITLLACARALWLMLFRPGSNCIAFSYEEGEARKLVEATWMMYLSLPEPLRAHVKVLTPKQAELPSEWIRLQHADGRISTFQASPATRKHGHGGRVTWAILDEAARQEYLRYVYTAISPAIGRGTTAKLALVSTANGVSNEQTGEGNYFHALYATKEEKGLAFQFLPWNLEPSRDEEWYQNVAMKLDEVERNQQYPLNEHDAFMLSGALYFDRDSLEFYRGETIKPLVTGQFVVSTSKARKALLTHTPQGCIHVFEKPRAGADYAIGVDTSSGKGVDYTVATVIDLTSGAPVAVLRAKMDAPQAALQLHYLGKWYNTALIDIERQGGYGESLIIQLRDGTRLLPVYSNLYRHVRYTRADRPISEEYGQPMGESNRGPLLNQLAGAIRERFFPWMPSWHMSELGTFIYRDSGTSPAAQDGCNDDCVLSLALAFDMYRQFGHRPDKPRKRAWKKRPYRPHPTRQKV